MFEAEDRNYLETKFSGVYKKVDDNYSDLLNKTALSHEKLAEKIQENKVELTEIKVKLNDVKEDFKNHITGNPGCINIQKHEEKNHKNMVWRFFLISGGVIAGIFAIIELLRRLL